jgi:hypothetical protein
MKRLACLLVAMVTFAAPALAQVTPFAFQASASRNPRLDRSAYVYPANHPRAGQVNENVGDVRLDSVSINGVVYGKEQIQLVDSLKVVIDDGVDSARGGANFGAGHGIGADRDSWVGEGIATTTPTAKDLATALGNFNLSSIAFTREVPGTAIYDVSFGTPVDALLLFERGSSGDVLVSALNKEGRVVGLYKVRDGANDAGLKNDYVPTGIFVTTFVQDGFANQGQELGSAGLRFSEPVTRFRFTSLQEPEGEGATRYNGPDLKIFALRLQR